MANILEKELILIEGEPQINPPLSSKIETKQIGTEFPLPLKTDYNIYDEIIKLQQKIVELEEEISKLKEQNL